MSLGGGMDNFYVLGSLAQRLHQEFVSLFYILLPIFFGLALAIDWIRNPAGSPDFIETIKRAFVATLLLVGFQEISDGILTVASGIADRIGDMSGIDSMLSMAAEKAKSYPNSTVSIILGFNDMILAIISFLSFIFLYFARYITVAVYHFMWIFLSIASPLLILFHIFRGTSQVTVNLFKSLIEVASYKIVWAILSAMLTALTFGNSYTAEGSYLTVIILNFVIAVAMLGTPMLVHSLVGGGLSSLGETLGAGAAIMMASAASKGVTGVGMARAALSNPSGFASHMGSKLNSTFTYPMPPPPPSNPAEASASRFDEMNKKMASKS